MVVFLKVMRFWIFYVKVEVLRSFFNLDEVVVSCVMFFVNGSYVFVVFIFSEVFYYFFRVCCF